MSHIPPPKSNSNSHLPLADHSEDVGVDHIEWSEQDRAGQGQAAAMKPALRGAIAIGWIAVVVGVIASWRGTEDGWMGPDSTGNFFALLGAGVVALAAAVLATRGKQRAQAFSLFLASAVLLAALVIIFLALGAAYAAMGSGG